MKISRLVPKLILLLPLAGFLLIGFTVLRRGAPLPLQLQRLIVSQMSRELKTDVAVSRITGQWLSGITFHDMVVGRNARLPGGALFSAPQVRVRYAGRDMLRGRVEPLAGIRSVTVRDAVINVRRDPDGKWNFDKMIPEPGKPRRRLFAAKILLQNARIVYGDEKLRDRSGRGFSIDLRDVGMDMQFNGERPIEFSSSVRDAAHRFGRVASRGKITPDGGYIEAHNRFNYADAAYFFSYFVRDPRLSMETATVRGEATVIYAKPVDSLRKFGSPNTLTYFGEVWVSDASFRHKQLPYGFCALRGPVAFSNQRVYLNHVTGHFGGTQFDAEGTATGFESPVFDFRLTSNRLDLDELMRLAGPLPKGFRVQTGSTASGTFEIAGGMSVVTVTGQAQLPSISVHSDAFGRFRIASANVNGGAENALKPTFNGTATFPFMQWSGATRYGVGVSLEGISHLRFVLHEIPHRPRVFAQFQAARGTAADIAFDGLQIEMQYQDNVVEVLQARANVDGGAVEAQGRMDLRGDYPAFAFSGQLKDAPSSAADRYLAEAGIESSGRLSGPFQLQGTEREVSVRGKLQTPALVLRPHEETPAAEWRQMSLGDLAADFQTNMRREGEQWDAQTLVDASASDGTLSLNGTDVRSIPFERLASHFRMSKDLLVLGSVSTESFGGDWRFSGDLRLADRSIAGHLIGSELDLQQLEKHGFAQNLSGTAILEGDVSGPLNLPHFKGYGRLVASKLDRFPIDYAEGQMDGDASHFEVSEIIAYQFGSRYSGSVEISDMDMTKQQGNIDANFLAEAVNASRLMDYYESHYAIQGLVHGKVHVTGSLESPRASGSVTIASGEVYGIPLNHATAELAYAEDRLRLSEVRGNTNGASLTAEGWVDRDGALQLAFSGQNVPAVFAARPAGLELPITGTVNVSGTVEGTAKDPRVRSRVQTTMLTLSGNPVGTLHGGVDFDGNVVRARDLLLSEGDTRVVVSGNFPLESGAAGLSTSLSVERAQLSNLLALIKDSEIPERLQGDLREFIAKLQEACENIPQPLSGSIDAKVSAQGSTSQPVIDVEMELADATLRKQPLPHTKVSMLWKDDALTVRSFHALQADAEMVMQPGVVLDKQRMLAMDFDIYNVDLAVFDPWIESETRISGIAKQIAVQASGPADSPHVTFSADIDQLKLGNITFDRVSALPATISEEGIAIEQGDLRFLKGRHQLEVWGHLPLDWGSASVPRDKPVDIHLQSRDEDLAVITKFVSEVTTASGRFDLLAGVSGTLDAPRFSGGLYVNDGAFTFQGVKENVENVDANIAFSDEGNRLVFHKVSGVVGTGTFQTNGSITIDPTNVTDLTAYAYHLKLQSRGISFDMKPKVEGVFSLDTNVSLDTAEDGSEQIRIAELTVKSSTGGRLYVDTGDSNAQTAVFLPLNWLKKGPWENASFHIPIKSEGLVLRLPKVFHGRVDADLALVNSDEDNQRLSPVTLMGTASVSNATLIGFPEQKGEKLSSPTLRHPALDVRFSLQEKVDVDTRLLRARNVSGEGHVTQTPANLNLNGTFAAQRGTIRFPSTEARLLFARVDVVTRPDDNTGEPLYTLNVNASAEAKVNQYQMRIAMTGPVTPGKPNQDFRFTIQSTPPFPGESEALQALLGMAPGEGETEADMANRAYTTLAGLFQQHPVFTEFERELENVLGIDTFSVDYEFGDALNISVGEEVAKGLILSYRRTISGPRLGYEYRIDYRVGNRTIIAFEADDRGLQEYKIERVLNF
ncbi:MAG: hypothetical protein GW893_00320 [Armatimonadetes bacterium]|nr:hypothetical protein [Armatimonadota bacterium]